MKSVNPFVIDMNLLVPVLVDTGAGLSIIPKKLCKNPKPIKKLSVKGVTGNSLQLAWTAELTLDIGFDDNSTHKFYVADIDQDYIIMGLDYMIPRGLFPVPHRNLLVEEKTGRSVQMVACSNNNFSTDEVWDKFLSTRAAGTSSKNDPTTSTVQLCEEPNEINEKKCHFAKNSVYLLGHTITSRGLQPLSDKVAAISNLLPPTNLTELRRFLGSLNYYRNFLPGIAETLAPLTNFLRGEKKPKKTKIKWEDTHHYQFDLCATLV